MLARIVNAMHAVVSRLVIDQTDDIKYCKPHPDRKVLTHEQVQELNLDLVYCRQNTGEVPVYLKKRSKKSSLPNRSQDA